MQTSVSTVIRTYNEAGFISQLIETLRWQEQHGNLEIIIVDSGSTDETVDIAKRYDVKIINIPKKTFNYSKALNLGIQQSRGELIFLLSAHSIPIGKDCLGKMAAHFEDENVAGVYCRQKPWPDAGPSEFYRIQKMFEPKSRTFSDEPCEGMTFSNAASCIRRRLWEKHPFAELLTAEDREWSKWAIINGHKIIYEAEAEVYHSHNDSSRKSAQRIIEMEKVADAGKNRRRNLLLTMKQSAGLFYREAGRAICFDCTIDKRIKFSAQSAARAFWYLVDFNRKG